MAGKVPFGPVNTAADIFTDPHVAARQMLVELEHPGSARPVTVASTPIRMTATPGGVAHRAPMIGENTVDVLRELGLSANEIETLTTAQIIGGQTASAER